MKTAAPSDLRQMGRELVFQITGKKVSPDECELQGDADFQIAMTYLRLAAAPSKQEGE